MPTPNHYIPQDVRERMAADPGNQPIFGNITPYQIELDIKYNTDEEYRSLVDEDRATNWKTEGSVYGIKAGVANIVNIPYNIAKLADYKIPDHIRYSDTPKYSFRGITDPFYVPTHKQPYFEESKRSFKENAIQGRFAFEGAFMYASMGGTEIFKHLITKAPAVASNGIVISESFGSNGISYLDEITMSEDAFFSSLRSRSIPYNAVNGTGSAANLTKTPMEIDLQLFASKRTGYTSGPKVSDLLRPDKSTRRTINVTEWRRSIEPSNIAYERELFLGEDAIKVDAGKWRSLDGTRQFRVKPQDYLGKHPIGDPAVPNTPHAHFEFLQPNAAGTKFEVVKNAHVPIK